MMSCCALQMGYNLLYGLQKASYDADCSLFLNILKEEVKVLGFCQHPALLYSWNHVVLQSA